MPPRKSHALASRIHNNRRWRYAIPILARKFVGANIHTVLHDGFDYFTAPEARGESDETMAEDSLIQKFADHFKVDIHQVTNKLIEQLPATIEEIGEKLAKDLAMHPDEKRIKKLHDAERLLNNLAKTGFRGDPVRSRILKSAARIAGIAADDIEFGR